MSDVRIRSSAGVIKDLCERRLRDSDDPKAIRDVFRQILGQIELILQADAAGGPYIGSLDPKMDSDDDDDCHIVPCGR